jgi:FkbM family methyltransferase
VALRKALPGYPAIARAVMPRLRILKVRIPGYEEPFAARWPSSDLHILHTIARLEEYRPLVERLDPQEPVVIIDLGANIGAAARYFLRRLPRARVVCVEPSAGNADLCRQNLAGYGDRVRVLERAVWSRSVPLVFRPQTTQAGTEAGIELCEAADGRGDVEGIDMPALLDSANIPAGVPVALKIDIEASEAALFSGPCLDWLDRISAIAIELHDSVDPDCSRNFYAAVSGRLRSPARTIGDTVFVELAAAAGSAPGGQQKSLHAAGL